MLQIVGHYYAVAELSGSKNDRADSFIGPKVGLGQIIGLLVSLTALRQCPAGISK